MGNWVCHQSSSETFNLVIDFLVIDRWGDHIGKLLRTQFRRIKKVDQHTSSAPRERRPESLCIDIRTHLVRDLIEENEVVTLEMFMQRHDGNAAQVSHGRIPSSPGNTDHTLIIITQEDLRSFTSKCLPKADGRDPIVAECHIRCDNLEAEWSGSRNLDVCCHLQ